MSYYIILYYIILHYITLYYTILYYIILYYIILYYIILYYSSPAQAMTGRSRSGGDGDDGLQTPPPHKPVKPRMK